MTGPPGAAPGRNPARCSATPSTDSAAIPGQHAWAWAWAQFWAHSSTRIGVNRPNLIFAVISPGAGARFGVELPSALAAYELRGILWAWNLGLRQRPGLTSGSPRSATTRRAGSP